MYSIILVAVVVYVEYVRRAPLSAELDDRDIAGGEINLLPLVREYIVSKEEEGTGLMGGGTVCGGIDRDPITGCYCYPEGVDRRFL
jgi:hypothetical protein